MLKHELQLKFVELELQGGKPIARISYVHSSKFDRVLVVIQFERFIQVATTNIFNGSYMVDDKVVHARDYDISADNVSKDVLAVYQLGDPLQAQDMQTMNVCEDDIEELVSIAKFAQVPFDLLGLIRNPKKK